MKIVVDTNVWVSAFIARTGICHYVLKHAMKFYTVVVSEYILKEFERILIAKLEVSEEFVRRILLILKHRIYIFEEKLLIYPNSPDAADSPILDLVLTVQPPYFISGDQALLKINKIGTTSIISPREAMKLFSA